MNVESAKFVRMSQRNGEEQAEVDVRVTGMDRPLKAYLRREGGRFKVAEVLGDDSDYEVDWYDNDMHQAFVDMSDRLLGDPAQEQAFVEQVLAQSNMQHEIDMLGGMSLQ